MALYRILSPSGASLFDTDKKEYLSFSLNGVLRSTELESFPPGVRPVSIQAISLLQEGTHTHIWTPHREGYSEESFLTLRKELLQSKYDSTFVQRGEVEGISFLKQIFIYTDTETLRRAEQAIWR